MDHQIKKTLGRVFYGGKFGRTAAWIGTLSGCGIYLLLNSFPVLYGAVLTLLVSVGLYTAGYYDREIAPGHSGPEAVMSDEIVGFMITMISFPFLTATAAETVSSLRYLLLGIALFRAFDSWKPAPVRHIADLPGGKGVLLDDVVAGIYANLVLQLIRLDPFKLALE